MAKMKHNQNKTKRRKARQMAKLETATAAVRVVLNQKEVESEIARAMSGPPSGGYV